MATIKWLGGTSTASSTAANWKGGSIPTAGDVALFDDEGLADCAWTLTGGSPVTVDEIVIESTFDHQVILNAEPTIKGLFINGTLNAGSAGAITFKHGSAPNYFGTYKSYAERFILIGDNATYVGSNTFSLLGSSSPITKFDDGQHPAVRINSGNFAPDYETPTGTSKKASFTSMNIASGGFAPESAFSDNDRLKIFDFTAFDATAVNTVNFGLATVEFTGSSGGVVLPTHNATGYSSTFQAYYRKIVLKAATAGHKVLLADNTFVSVEEFEIQDGCVLKGPTNIDAQGSEVRSIVTPKIRGTWSYSQISPGIYRSPRHASGPIDLINGNVHITGKLNVDGLIDPTGLELDPVSSNPGGVAANTLWLNSADSNKLYHGSSEVGGGGGGGGITALTGDVTASGSGSVAATLDIDGMNAGGEPVNADLLVMDDGANGTNRKITFTQVASWVENNVSVAHIRDARADGDIHPNEFPDKAVSFNFTDDITGSPNSWDSVMTLKGWTDNYRAWQIYSSSASGSQSVDEVPLFFRSGEEDVQDGWGATKEILTFPGTAPRVDGSNGQVLQTNGSGTLSWATLTPSVAPITLDTGNNRVGINEASPDYDLHVHSGNSNYSVKFEHGQGQTLFNSFGHIQIQNDNTSPTDGSTLDNPVWQIGQRDGGQFDISLGNISTQLVPASKKLIELKRVGNSESGAIQIGFFGATAASQPTAQGPMAFGFNPATATANEQALQQSLDSVIASLQALGLSA